MPNREMVMKGLVCSFSASGPSAQAPECPCCFRFIAKRKGTTCDAVVAEQAYELLKEQPEQKHGHWKGFTQSRYFGMDDDGEPIFRDGFFYVCSECRRKTVIKTQFCPRCGAKMDEEVKQDG